MRDWNRERWHWKRAVRKDTRLSDAAKLLAVALCDDFAHHETAFCNPEVGTIAEALGKSDRSVQRAIQELRKAEWIVVQYARGRGRSSQISFKKGDGTVEFEASKKVTSMASNDLEKVTTVAQKGDNRVTPYNEPKTIQREGRVSNEEPLAVSRFKNHRFLGSFKDGPSPVPKSNHGALNKWAEWLECENLPTLCSLPLSQLHGKKSEVFFHLPSRNPPTTPAATAEALTYFRALMDWEGARHAAQ